MIPEINNPHFERPASIRNSGRSTYRTYRLVISEFCADRAIVGLIVTDIFQRTLSDTRVNIGQISRIAEDGAMVSIPVLCQRAVHLL